MSLPPDVLAVLEGVDDRGRSAYVADAIRIRHRREQAWRVITEAGYTLDQERVEAMGLRFRAADRALQEYYAEQDAAEAQPADERRAA